MKFDNLRTEKVVKTRDVNPCPCLVLKDSLRTFVKSLSLSWSLGSGPFPCPGPWGSGPCHCSGPCGSGPCPYPGSCGLVLVLVFSSCKDLFPLFHYSDLFAYYCSVNAYN